MLRSLKEQIEYTIVTKDGESGDVYDFLLRDDNWTIRFLVVDTLKWLPGRKIIIPPHVLDKPDRNNRVLPVTLTMDEIKGYPPLDEKEPVSHEYEKRLYKHFNWIPYWEQPFIGTMIPPRSSPLQFAAAGAEPPSEQPEKEPHDDLSEGAAELRSCREILDYAVHAKDGDVGSVDDLLADEEAWVTRHLVAKVKDHASGEKVLLAAPWVKSVNWGKSQVTFDLAREDIRSSPPYDPEQPVDRGVEEALYDHYGRPLDRVK